ncbi:MAG: P-loop NTPase, partial [Planctomycetota bacterium]
MARARRHSGGNGETKQRRGNIVVIASGKGGVGKTTLAVNMGLHLARAGLRTVLVDADFGGANPELFLGTSARASLAELAPSAATPSGPNRQSTGTLDTLLAHATGGLELITAHSGPGSLPAPEGQPRPGRRAVASASSSTARALTDLSAARDFVLVDVGAGLPCELRSAVDAADWLLLVTTPEPAAGAAAYSLLKLLAAHGSPSLPLGLRTGVVVNMAHDPHEAGQVAGRLAQ